MEKMLFLTALCLLIFAILSLPTITGLSTYENPSPTKIENFSCNRCNIILITVDTLRPDHLSSYGYARNTSPNIDSIAANGLKFTNAFSQIPFTPPSHWSIMTGLYPNTHKIQLNPDGLSFNVSHGELPILAEILKENNYAVYETGGFTSSYIVKSLGEGFDTFEHFNSSESTSIASVATGKASAWMEKQKGKKFFLWIHYWDPHQPYNPPAEFNVFNDSRLDSKFKDSGIDLQPYSEDRDYTEYQISKYDGEIRYVDSEIGGLLEKIRELGLDENTIIIITSDHGECFGERRYGEYSTSREKCQGHETSLFDETIRIPLIIYNPKTPASKEIQQHAQTIDILPTILSIIGIPADTRVEGKSLVPAIERNEKVNSYIFSELYTYDRQAKSIRENEWKFVKIVHGDKISRLLHNMRLGESRNLMALYPSIASRLEDQLELKFHGSTGKTTSSSEEINILRSLGYIS